MNSEVSYSQIRTDRRDERKGLSVSSSQPREKKGLICDFRTWLVFLCFTTGEIITFQMFIFGNFKILRVGSGFLPFTDFFVIGFLIAFSRTADLSVKVVRIRGDRGRCGGETQHLWVSKTSKPSFHSNVSRCVTYVIHTRVIYFVMNYHTLHFPRTCLSTFKSSDFDQTAVLPNLAGGTPLNDIPEIAWFWGKGSWLRQREFIVLF